MSNPNPNHPEAIKAAQRAQKYASVLEGAKRHDVQFLHVGIYTVAYRVDRRSVVELSTAIRNPIDRHNAAEGRIVAFERFAAGNRITLRLANGNKKKIKEQLRLIFCKIDFVKESYDVSN